MQLRLQDNLPFVTVRLIYNGESIDIPNVLIGTGSGRRLFAANEVSKIGIVPQSDDILHHIHGVGGSEVVFIRRVEALQVGEHSQAQFDIEVGGCE